MPESIKKILPAAVETYGQLNGQTLYLVRLRNSYMEVTITNIGCAICAIQLPDKQGIKANVVAGFSDPEMYRSNPYYCGSVIGRYANRIAEGKFLLDGKPIQLTRNNGPNHLHGGFEGLDKKIWHLQSLTERDDAAGVKFTCSSAAGEEGYPGNLQLSVHYWLNAANELHLWYEATTDSATPVNLTNHTYFNLSGFSNPVIHAHYLQVHAAAATEKNAGNLPTGNIVPVAGSALDFTTPQQLDKRLGCFPGDGGLDHNFVLDVIAAGSLVHAAELFDPASGRMVRVLTNRPGIQVYTANWWDGSIKGAQGVPYVKHGAVALETQAYPDSPNHPRFPDTLLRPGNTYTAHTVFAFGLKQ